MRYTREAMIIVTLFHNCTQQCCRWPTHQLLSKINARIMPNRERKTQNTRSLSLFSYFPISCMPLVVMEVSGSRLQVLEFLPKRRHRPAFHKTFLYRKFNNLNFRIILKIMVKSSSWTILFQSSINPRWHHVAGTKKRVH